MPLDRVEEHRGATVRVSASEHLTRRERSEVAGELVHLVDNYRDVLKTLPAPLSWALGSLRAREPILERLELIGDRVQWGVRLPPFGDVERLARPCFSCRRGLSPATSLPPELAWLAANLGDCYVETDSSGTSPWGVPLASVRDQMFEGVFESLPAAAADWVTLYEADGDWLCADLSSGRAYWTGLEWTGQASVGFPSWRRVLHFVLWRLLDGGRVRPADLEMLFAGGPPATPPG